MAFCWVMSSVFHAPTAGKAVLLPFDTMSAAGEM